MLAHPLSTGSWTNGTTGSPILSRNELSLGWCLTADTVWRGQHYLFVHTYTQTLFISLSLWTTSVGSVSAWVIDDGRTDGRNGRLTRWPMTNYLIWYPMHLMAPGAERERDRDIFSLTIWQVDRLSFHPKRAVANIRRQRLGLTVIGNIHRGGGILKEGCSCWWCSWIFQRNVEKVPWGSDKIEI